MPPQPAHSPPPRGQPLSCTFRHFPACEGWRIARWLSGFGVRVPRGGEGVIRGDERKMNGRADFQEPNAEVPRPIPHIGADYIPTEEERRVFAECNDESFWFRSVPLAATSMLITQGLISKGILSSHPRYGSIPKLLFACIMGYFAGKLSYVKTCQEKFKNLENSPLGEALRSGQARRSSPSGHYSQKSKYDSNVSGHSSFVTSPAADNIEKDMLPHYEPIPFSASMNESTPTGITDHIAQVKVNKYGDTWDE
ncbi:OCIA domain-containing protein 1 isoform X2 [Acinonyx jubatus]|uniref:OCIA domain-containing protein 1 n=1 Tax=Acinonyx jubatus TaxID=32536 RepID=A0A6J1Z5K8_ACIJB|nr:OCIA domain-containing protein 1 isoform X2 [Acinonyx jubatus]